MSWDCDSRPTKQLGCSAAAGLLAAHLEPMMTNTQRAQLSHFRSASAWLFVMLFAFVTPAQQSDDSAEKPARPPTAAETELPYNQQPINYSQATSNDPIALLKARLDAGKLTLQREGESGVLRDVLRQLNVPESSQLLVFSKSSANAKLIKPQTPRAIYFNDDVYVGWVPGSSAIELSGVDAALGGTFYSLSPVDNAQPLIRRDESCLLCHLSRSTLRVPGHLVRSFTTDALGELRTGWSRITHETPYEKRWAGWYVTGKYGELPHLGNVFGLPRFTDVAGEKNPPHQLPLASGTSRYLRPESDVLPHLVLDHQAHGHNLITRLNYEVRLQKPVTALEPLVRYMLFLDEPPLPEPIIGNAEYRAWFERQGPRDPQGRSLRQFDLQTRLFKYRLSYLIYTPAFDALPAATRDDVYARIKTYLTATNSGGSVPADERQSIMTILRATRTGLPDGW